MPLIFDWGQCSHIACVWEATARKIGNVHRFHDFASTSYLDFILSAGAIQECLTFSPRRGVGETVWQATAQTQFTVKQNTNLGIILLLAPLVQISEYETLRIGLPKVLNGLTQEDTELVYDAIRHASPGGLGEAAEQDVANTPTVTLLEAMQLAADRDLIARQYANGYADIFDFGVPAFLDAFAKFGCIEAAIIACQLQWLAKFPDSLIARKKGLAVAEDVQRRVQDVLTLGGLNTPDGRRAGVALDRHLCSEGNRLNPGTTADLVTACLFVALRENYVQPHTPFAWRVDDWL